MGGNEGMTSGVQMQDGGSANGIKKGGGPSLKPYLVLVEILMIVVLLFIWLFSPKIRETVSLTILFLYSFPSEFLIGLVPHEPVLIFYGRHYSPWIVAAVAAVSTVLAEGVNYSVFGFVCNTSLFIRMRKKRAVENIVGLFDKAPFTAIIVAGFTPIPFFPIRFLVVMSHYPILKYMLGVFISRAPRFFLLAGAGYLFDIPGWILALIFVIMIVTINIPLVMRLLRSEDRE